jgi:hypothetical protein
MGIRNQYSLSTLPFLPTESRKSVPEKERIATLNCINAAIFIMVIEPSHPALRNLPPRARRGGFPLLRPGA